MHTIAAIVAQQTPNDEGYVPVYLECTNFNSAEVMQPPQVPVSCINKPIGIHTGPCLGVHAKCQSVLQLLVPCVGAAQLLDV